MYIQEQLSWELINDEILSFLRAIGVDYLTVNPAPEMRDGEDRAEYWASVKALAEKHGLKLQNVAATGWNEVSLGLEDRDEKIEAWCTMLRNLGEVGVPTLGYNFKPVGNFRTTSAVGRGGVLYSTFDYDEWAQNPPRDRWIDISEPQMWENLRYFLERVIPVAEESNVRMALHPDDPPIPEVMCGAARIVSSLEQYERIFNLVESDCNAMLFCQGCVAEMDEDVYEAIGRIGRQNKIVYVHFRDIQGSGKSFREVFIDEGKTDMQKAMQTYKDVGFNGPFMMDHTPRFPQEEAGWMAGRAFAVGYMRAMIQTVWG